MKEYPSYHADIKTVEQDPHPTTYCGSYYKPFSDTDQYSFRQEKLRRQHKKSDKELALRLGAALLFTVIGLLVGLLCSNAYGVVVTIGILLVVAALGIVFLMYILLRRPW